MMKNNLNKITELLFPCLILGVFLALVIGLFIMLSYVLVWGLLIGAVLWIGVSIKNQFFPEAPPNKREGRVFEHRDQD